LISERGQLARVFIVAMISTRGQAVRAPAQNGIELRFGKIIAK
jgi:hypothetical protein